MEPIEVATTRFECPVHWCAGNVWEHGGDGAPPDTWMHVGETEQLPAGGSGSVVQEPGRSIEYAVYLRIESSEDAASLPRLAGELRQLADVFDSRAVRVACGVL